MRLPINKEPGTNAYTHHMFINAMIGSRELLRLQVSGSSDDNWDEYVKDTEFKWNKDILSLAGKNFEINTESCIVRNCDSCDEITIGIEYSKKQEFTISLFISEDNPMECFHSSKGIYKLGMNNYGLIFVDKFIANDSIELYNYSWLKIVCRNAKVYAYISDNGNKWILVDEGTFSLENNERQKKIGIITDFGSNQYYNWKYMNYIQLFYNVNDIYGKVWLDYYLFPRKNIDYAYQCACHFLYVEYSELKEMIDLYGDINRFIRWCIDHNYYVSICLDEYYIPDRLAYQNRHYLHYSLIYGYDQDKNSLNLLGYNDRIVTNEITANTLEQAISTNSEVVRYKININVKKLPFNIKSVIRSVKEYIDGTNSSEGISNIISQRDGVYGIQVLQELIDTERGRELLRMDKRISYLLFEHCKIMEERLTFLFSCNYLNWNSKANLMSLCREMVVESEKLKNLFLKHKLTNQEESSIINRAKVLYKSEMTFYKSLYESLHSNDCCI